MPHPTTSPTYILDFVEITLGDLARVGGKNASLGELFAALKPKGVGVLDGFAATADAYWRLLRTGDLEARLRAIFSTLHPEDLADLARAGQAARAAVLETPIPDDVRTAILAAYERLTARLGREPEMAVRSSATAEDLPEASFAGAAETFLNVRGREGLLRAVQACYSSLFTDRAISYRARLGYDQMKVALSVGVQPMVRSDQASAGVIFTLDTESGFRDVVTVTGAYGLGEFVVQGVVTPDEWTVFKPTLATGHPAIIGRRLGTKEVRLVYAGGSKSTRSEPTPLAERSRFCLADDDVLTLARWACAIEEHYSERAGHAQPMDIEWARDGLTGGLFIVQARPETVHSAKSRTATAEIYRLTAPPGPPLVTWTGRRREGGSRARADRPERERARDGKVRRSARRGDDRPRLGTHHAPRLCHRDRQGRSNRPRRDRLPRVRPAVHCRCGRRHGSVARRRRGHGVLRGRGGRARVHRGDPVRRRAHRRLDGPDDAHEDHVDRRRPESGVLPRDDSQCGCRPRQDRVRRHQPHRDSPDGARPLSEPEGFRGGETDRRENRTGGRPGVFRAAVQRRGRAYRRSLLSEAGHRSHERLQDQ